MSGVLNLLLSSAAGVIRDAYFNLVTLLLNTTATNGAQNNTFLDSSTNNFTVTRNGNTTQGTFTPFSQTGWSNSVTATGSYLTVTSQPLINVNDWTVEFWMYPTQYNNNGGIFGASNGGGTNPKLYLYVSGSNLILEGYLSPSFFTALSTPVPTLNQWTYVSVSRSSSTGNAYLYYNGVQQGSAAAVSAITGITGGFSLFSNGEGSSAGFYGYMSNMRVSDIARYTGSSYSVPTAPSTAIANTTLLTAQSNRFVDNSTNGYAIAVTGTPSVQAFSPFAPTIEYDAAVVGGSGYFDGTGDYLTIGSGTDVDLGSSDFMIEAWYYCLQNGTYASGVFCKRVGGVASGWGMNTVGFVCDMNGTWYDSWANPFWVGSTQNSGYNSSTSLQKLNQWTHIVVTRQGTDARWFVNGQLLGYFSRTGTIQQLTGSPLAVGLGGTTAEQPFIGYLSNGRVVVGSVPTSYQTSSTTLNTQIFTPPTAPVTTTSQGATSANVKYIGNFINAGIYDSAAKNVLETVGNAQVSTTVAKWGTTSMYFAGTGTYPSYNTSNFVGPANAGLYNFRTGNFTIEAWINLSVTTTGRAIVSSGYNADTGAGGWTLTYRGDISSLSLSVNANVVYSKAWSPSATTWYHVAVCRSGTDLRFFVDGTQIGTTSTSADDISGSSTIVVGGNSGGANLNFYGYIDDLRITNYARYTANFTPPAAAFPLL